MSPTRFSIALRRCFVDARDRLRLYLEQRRELGESELVLDGLAVDDVMAMLGARATAKPPRGTRSPVSAMTPPSVAVPLSPTPTGPPDDQAVAPPTLPAVRFDDNATGDWRHALRTDDAASAQPRDAVSAGAEPTTPAQRRAIFPAWLTALGLPMGMAAGGDIAAPNRAVDTLPLSAASTLEAVAELVRGCTRCPLHASAHNSVSGEGDPRAELVCIGEAPGANEDEQGRPFVGDAGQLLTKILAAIQLTRDAVFICNVLKHRPPANRDPMPDEVAACQPYLRRQLEIVKPRVILALGRFAAQTLLETTIPLGKLRGQVHQYRGIPVVVTYHPAALLRNESWKRPAWEDVKFARTILDASRAASGSADPRHNDIARD